jgi:hypothetical protein
VKPGALFERDPIFTPAKIYRKRINVSESNPFPNLPERIGGMEEWFMTCGGSGINAADLPIEGEKT